MDGNLFLAGFLLGTTFGGALAIKAGRRSGSRTTREPRATKTKPQPAALPAGRDDVIAALQGLGFKKTAAVCAVDACTPAERATIESWTRSALNKASS